MALTDYLQAMKVENTPKIGGTPHCTKGPDPLPTNQKLSRTLMRLLRYLIWRSFSDATTMVGTSGELYNATGSFNIADYQAWEIVACGGESVDLAPEWGALGPYELALAQRGNPQVLVVFARKNNTVGLSVLQPGDRIHYEWPSCLAFKSSPMVMQILGIKHGIEIGAETWGLVRCKADQFTKFARTSGDEWNPFPTRFVCKTWRHAGNAEPWQDVYEPEEARGTTVQTTILNANLDGHKKYELKRLDGGSCPIQNPRQADPENLKPESFKVLGIHPGGVTTTDITTQFLSRPNGRVLVQTLGPHSWKTHVYFGALGPRGVNLGNDLTFAYIGFVIKYVALEPRTPGGERWCHARCAFSTYDDTNSVANMGTTVGAGKDPTTQRHWHCRLKWREFQTGTPEDDFWVQPTGVVNYPGESGLCLQWGGCDMYQPLEEQTTPGHGVFDENTYARLMRQMSYNVRMKLEQLFPGYNTTSNFVYSMVGCTSLLQCLGGPSLTNRIGFHPTVVFPMLPGSTMGGLFGVKRITTDEGTGDKQLSVTWGAHYDMTNLWSGVAFATNSPPPPGVLVTQVPGFSTQHHPTSYTDSWTNTTDPNGEARRWWPRSAWTVFMDTGLHGGRGMHHYSRTIGQSSLLSHDYIDLDEYNVDQESPDLIFKRFSTPFNLMNHLEPYGATLTFKGLPERWKQVRSGGVAGVSGVVHKVTVIGANRYAIEIKHKQWIFDVVGGLPGERHDILHIFYGGGHFVKLPYWATPLSYYNRNEVGDVARGCWPGDCIAFGGSVGGVNFSQLRFLVEAAAPCSPLSETAPDWGNRTETTNFSPDGHFPSASVLSAFRTTTRLYVDAVLGDPDDGGWVHGSVEGRDLENAFDQPNVTDAAMGILKSVPLKYGVILKNSRTGELVKVTGVAYGNGGIPESGAIVDIERGVAGTTPQGLLAKDVWEWQMVVQTGTNVPFIKLTDSARPSTIPAGRYWVDTAKNHLYFSEPDDGLHYDFFYTIKNQWQLASTDKCYSFHDQVITKPSKWKSPFAYGVGTPAIYGESGTEFTSTAFDPPTIANTYFAYNDGGNWAFKFQLKEAGRNMRMDVDFGTTISVFPGADVKASDFETYGKRYDRIEVVDDTGFIAYVGPSNLVGHTITQQMQCGGWKPTSDNKLKAAGPTGGFSDLRDGFYTREHGRCLWYITQAELVKLRADHGRRIKMQAVAELLDHRARKSAESVNELIDAVDVLLSTVATSFGAGTGALYVEMQGFQGPMFTHGQLIAKPSPLYGPEPTYGVARGADPVKSGNGFTVRRARNSAIYHRWRGRGCGGYDFGWGYTTYNGEGVTESDMLLNGDTFAVQACNFGGVVATAVADSSLFPDAQGNNPSQHPYDPVIPIEVQVDVPGGIPWTEVFTHSMDLFDTNTGVKNFYFMGRGMMDPTGGYHDHGVSEGGGGYNKYPIKLEGGPIGFGGSGLSGIIGFAYPKENGAGGAAFNGDAIFTGEGFTWGQFLKQIPRGCTVLDAALNIKCSGLVKTDWSFEGVIDGETGHITYQRYDENGNPDPDGDYEVRNVVNNSGIAFTLFGRRLQRLPPSVCGTRAFEWEPLGISLPAGSVTSDKWDVVNVKEALQAYLDGPRDDSEYDSFCWVPSPYKDVEGLTNGKEYVKSLMPSINITHWLHPELGTGINGDIYVPSFSGPNDVWGIQQSASGSWVQWSGIQLGSLVVTYQRPTGERLTRAFVVGNLPPFHDPEPAPEGEEDRYPRPIQLGVSGSNLSVLTHNGECSGGTLGCLVTDGTDKFILSNNHVFAYLNEATPGDLIVNPGPIDSGCVAIPTNAVAELTRFIPLDDSENNVNLIDAAIAKVFSDKVDPSGSIVGIGVISSETVEATVGLRVKKTGRTTGTTFGVVEAIDLTVEVLIEGWALFGFEEVIGIGPTSFSEPGDSGSLIVTDLEGQTPKAVGLLFAGVDGGLTYACKIDSVLERLGVTMVGS